MDYGGNASGQLTPISTGVSGSYLLTVQGRKVGVFKPVSEEPFTRSPPEERRALKSGITWGDFPTKEVSAYLLDHDGFAGVPPTIAPHVTTRKDGAVLAIQSAALRVPSSCPCLCHTGEEERWKRHEAPVRTEAGSLQAYEDHECTADDIGTAAFDPEQVHRIGVLDLRILNLDRHEGNLLVARRASPAGWKDSDSKNQWRLVPIDHSYSLPDWRDHSDVWFCWAGWKQAKMPFSAATRRYIRRLNPLKDAKLLHSLGVKTNEIISMILSTRLLQLCTAAGFCLADIAALVQRDVMHPHTLSALETLARRAAREAGWQARNGNHLLAQTQGKNYNVREDHRSVGVSDVFHLFLSRFEYHAAQLILEWRRDSAPVPPRLGGNKAVAPL